MFPVQPAASILAGEWVEWAWSKRGWRKGQISWKVTQGRHRYKLPTFFLFPSNYVSNVQRLGFLARHQEELGNHIDSRLDLEFSTFLPAMYAQTIYLSISEVLWFLPHIFSSWLHLFFFLVFCIPCLNFFNKGTDISRGNKTDENMVLYFPLCSSKFSVLEEGGGGEVQLGCLFLLLNWTIWKERHE